jgi:hypothetical protein
VVSTVGQGSVFRVVIPCHDNVNRMMH